MNIPTRNENSFIRNLFRMYVSKDPHSQDNIRYYNDLRTNARRRRIFKSDDVPGVERAWRRVLEHLEEFGLKGWRLYKGADVAGDGYKVGIRKYQDR